MDDRSTSINIKIYDHLRDEILSKPIMELTVKMVASQMPATFEIEALKAQAIMARTFIIRRARVFGGNGCIKYKNADLCIDGHCITWLEENQMREMWGEKYEENWNKISEAVSQTEDLIITMNNKPIEPKYHSTCGGATENAENIEQNRILYLRKVLCDYCGNSPYFQESMEITLDEMERLLKIGTIKPTPETGGEIEGIIENVERDEAGRIISIRLGGKNFKGTEVMELLGLNSTRFGWKPIAFRIEMQGKGNGLGLCQYGANTMAQQGFTAEEIIKYYFTGVQIKKFEKPSINQPLSGKIIILDPGHGGDNTEDVTGPTGLREKDINLAISIELARLLRKAGATVYETRTEDVYVSLSKRAELSTKVRPSFFISIHQNFFANPNISGSEIYFYRGDREGETLANFILEELSRILGTIPRGAKIADFYLLREVRSSVIQIEVGFITNPEEEEKMRQKGFGHRTAEAIASGLIKYYRYE